MCMMRLIATNVFKKHVVQFHGSDGDFRFQKRRFGSGAWFQFGTQSFSTCVELHIILMGVDAFHLRNIC